MFAEGHWACAIDGSVPRRLRVGRGSALFLSGWLFHRRSPLRDLALFLGDTRHEVRVHSMPRLDVLNAHGRAADEPPLAAYRSGFWAVLPISAPPAPHDAPLRLHATTESGDRWECDVASVQLDPAPVVSAAAPPESGLIAICMATFNPDLELFRRQIESIRAQTHDHWRCIVNDDLSRPEVFAAMERELAGDARFELHRNSERLGFYFNFERALQQVPPEAEAVALADQDDAWYPEKLTTLLAALRGGAMLAYCDQRIVRRDGAVVAPSYWIERDNQWTDLRTLLLANTVTGAASLFRRELLDAALPLPPRLGPAFHDHWLAAVALASGGITFVDKPLYDYVQHGEQVIGHSQARGNDEAPSALAGGRYSRERELLFPWQDHYFKNVLPQQLAATVLLERLHGRLSDADRRMLARLAEGDETWRGVAEHLRALRRASGRTVDHHDRETIAGLAWRRWIKLRARTVDRPFADERHTVHPRPAYVDYGPDQFPHTPQRDARHLGRLELTVDAAAPAHINVVVPGDGWEGDAAMGLANALTAAGASARVVHAGEPLAVSPQDRWIATGWQTAFAAHEAAGRLGRNGFVYLIAPQAAYAFFPDATYRLPHRAVFVGEATRALFRQRSLGVYAAGARDGDKASATFEVPIAASGAPDRETLERRRPRRLLLAAPDAEAAQLGVLALDAAVERGVVDASWELWAGPWSGGRAVGLARGRSLQPLDAASALGAGADVALVVGWLPPLAPVAVELAAGGASVVVALGNGVAPDALTALSANLRPAEPTREALTSSLSDAIVRADDIEARLAGAQFSWPRDWDQALAPKTLKRILGLLDETA